ncbi:MAG: hypothetical protein RLZZ532_3730, partial [Cyanobacteriota bacterium]
MDVELQIIKHLARDAQPTVSVIDEYCQGYKDLFPEVRSYECFKYLHLGIISPIPRNALFVRFFSLQIKPSVVLMPLSGIF